MTRVDDIISKYNLKPVGAPTTGSDLVKQQNSLSGRALLDSVEGKQPGVVDAFKSSLEKNTQALVPGVQREAAGQQTQTETGIQALGAGAKTVEETVKALPGAKKASELGHKIVENTIPQPIKDLAAHPAVQSAWEKIKSALGPHLDNFTKENPRLADDLSSILHVGTVAGTALGAAGIAGEVAQGVKQVVSETPEALSSAANTVKTAASDLKNKFSPQSEAKIVATPESQVHKLNPLERDYWFKKQTEQITEKSSAVNARVKQDLQVSSDKSAKELETLQKKLAVTSRDKVLELRPKIIKAMGEQSKTYRGLVDEAMSGKEDLPVDNQRIKDFVDSRFAEDPGRAAAIKDRLGLTEQVDPLSGKPTQLKPQTTLGEIYSKTKGLKQDLSAGKVFTSDDKLTDDAIHILSSYMKGQGVDLAEANQFWAKYAPVRDQLVSEAKPFVQSGTQTKTFAKTLERVAKGTDVNNENFINEVENMIGEPISKEVSAVVKKLDANQKASLAKELEAKLLLEENKTATDEALKGLSKKELQVKIKARTRDIIKKTLLGVGIYEANRKLKESTGLGL